MKAEKARQLMKAEELYHLPSELPGLGPRFYELDQGILLVREPGGFYHADVGTQIVWHLLAYVKQHPIGKVTGPDTGFVIRRNPDSVLCPDAAFIIAERCPQGEARLKFFEGAPDLAVEVISPSDRLVAVERKMRKYIEAGTRLAWAANGRNQTVTVYREDAIPQILIANDFLDGEDVLPGFRVSVAEIF